jgi:tetratricopeptide (TPR) repeat protein
MKRFRAYRSGISFCLAGILSVFLLPASATAESCTRWVAKVVSVQGSVQAQRMGEERPFPARLNDTFCPGDKIRVEEEGRAVLLLSNETLLRLDRNTTIRFYEPERERNFLLDLLDGAAYFISRTPKRFQCTTPFVNAGVEGTEFLLVVGNGKTFLSVFEGTVLAGNAHGALRLAGGESAVAEEGKPPVVRVVARPRDAVQWTLYYPPILPPGSSGDFPGALGTWQSRVSRLLSVGRVDEAKLEIEEVLNRSPGDASALSLQSVIAVAQNEKGEALDLGRKAVDADPRHAPARIALSYAQQSGFDLAGARTSVGEALRLEPGNALAWARMSELWMSSGDLDEALVAANRAVNLDPDLARTHSVLGFAYLAQIRTAASREAFEKAISLDTADPLPRLGLGLARIREGDIPGGRTEIEIAASLSPNNSLVRSYLGKAYYEEKRDKPASSQLELAKELDPSDPTPFFYDAIRKQSLNRPVEALRDLQESISLNDNRAVYRSRLLLDEDLAARSASLGRIYDDLGFQQMALVEGWKSVNTDPANYSAHRFLADSYAALPRHEIARVSELLQSQLLQPINISPVQPQSAQGKQLLLSGSGPASPSFNEFNPLFNRDRLALQASGVAGSNKTFGDEVVLSAVQGKVSFSVGQFHYETDGFRENNDFTRNIYNLFLQASLSHKTSVQAEVRQTDTKYGDLTLRFNPDDFYKEQRNEEEGRSARFGFHHAFSPGSDLIGSVILQDRTVRFHDNFGVFLDDFRIEEHSDMVELQHLFRGERLSTTIGVGQSEIRQGQTENLVFLPLDSGTMSISTDSRTRQTNVYLYSQIRLPANVTATVGASADFLTSPMGDRDQVNPKLGLTWNPVPGTTLRAAAFRVLKKELATDQTIEPTQVAGFNQFFDDPTGTRAWNYGVAIDRKFSPAVAGGAEYSWRDLVVLTNVLVDPVAGTTAIVPTDWNDRLGRAYLYWTPGDRVALSAEYLYERLDRGTEFAPDGIVQVTTHKVPLGIGYFHPLGMIARLKSTFHDQNGRFMNGTNPDGDPGSDRFWIFDASIGYRLPERWGILSLEAKNLFDKSFRFQDTDRANPLIQPNRTVYCKVLLAF